MKRKWTFTENRGDGGTGEAARFVGMWAGTVPGTALNKYLRLSIPGYDPDDNDGNEEAFNEALNLLRQGGMA